MQIEHIFSAIKSKEKNNINIDSQELKIEYWKNPKEGYIPPKDLKSDFAKMYYTSLVPLSDKSIISKYDDEKINKLVNDLGDDLLLICGDFWGIQKFIFDGLTSSKASKILRSRSAMVELITFVVIDRIKEEFDGSGTLLFGAGKFMVLAKNEDLNKIKNIQKELDKYFLENFFGQNGFILTARMTSKDKILNQKQMMEEDLNILGADNDAKKLNKFDLLNVKDDDVLIDPFKGKNATDSTSCKFCNKRIESYTVDDAMACSVCYYQIELGKRLTQKRYLSIFSSQTKETKDNIEIIQLGDRYYYSSFSDNAEDLEGEIFDVSCDEYYDYPKWSLNSYVAKSDDAIKTFDDYIKKDEVAVSSGLMALKADIDKLGNVFRKLYKDDFKKFNRLSREVEFFFCDYITSLVAKKENVYTIFAGGDDLFLIGEYKEIMELVREIRDEFYEFSLNKATISMGLVMFKPTTPINFVSNMADEAEKRAKVHRDSIDIFGVSMSFDEFYEIEREFEKVTKFLEHGKDDKSSFYYRLIELCDMKENIDKDVRNAMWRSKLNYLFKRSVKRDDRNDEIVIILDNLIERGEKFKPSIFLKIYKNRDNKKGELG